jgi:hypothetical protein
MTLAHLSPKVAGDVELRAAPEVVFLGGEPPVVVDEVSAKERNIFRTSSFALSETMGTASTVRPFRTAASYTMKSGIWSTSVKDSACRSLPRMPSATPVASILAAPSAPLSIVTSFGRMPVRPSSPMMPGAWPASSTTANSRPVVRTRRGECESDTQASYCPGRRIHRPPRPQKALQ